MQITERESNMASYHDLSMSSAALKFMPLTHSKDNDDTLRRTFHKNMQSLRITHSKLIFPWPISMLPKP